MYLTRAGCSSHTVYITYALMTPDMEDWRCVYGLRRNQCVWSSRVTLAVERETLNLLLLPTQTLSLCYWPCQIWEDFYCWFVFTSAMKQSQAVFIIIFVDEMIIITMGALDTRVMWYRKCFQMFQKSEKNAGITVRALIIMTLTNCIINSR